MTLAWRVIEWSVAVIVGSVALGIILYAVAVVGTLVFLGVQAL